MGGAGIFFKIAAAAATPKAFASGSKATTSGVLPAESGAPKTGCTIRTPAASNPSSPPDTKIASKFRSSYISNSSSTPKAPSSSPADSI
jgi:hypothetical protein